MAETSQDEQPQQHILKQRLADNLRKHHTKYLWSALVAVLSAVLWDMIPTTVKLALVILASIIAVYLICVFASQHTPKWKPVLRFRPCLRAVLTALCLVGCLTVIALEGFILRDRITSFLSPPIQVAVGNVSIVPSSHETLWEGELHDVLLVEVRVAYHDTDLNAELTLSGEYTIISEYWDTQYGAEPSPDAVPLTGTIVIEDRGGLTTLGKAQVLTHDVSPPSYKIRTKTVMLTPSRSFYVAFLSDGTLSATEAKFDGAELRLQDGIFTQQDR